MSETATIAGFGNDGQRDDRSDAWEARHQTCSLATSRMSELLDQEDSMERCMTLG